MLRRNVRCARAAEQSSQKINFPVRSDHSDFSFFERNEPKCQLSPGTGESTSPKILPSRFSSRCELAPPSLHQKKKRQRWKINFKDFKFSGLFFFSREQFEECCEVLVHLSDQNLKF